VSNTTLRNMFTSFTISSVNPVETVHDSFLMLYAYGEIGELEEEMRRSFHAHFKKGINVKSEIGVMVPLSFDGKDSDE